MVRILEKIALVLHPFLRLLFGVAVLCGVALFFAWDKLSPKGVISLILLIWWLLAPRMIDFTFYPSQTEIDPNSTTVLTHKKVSHFQQMSKVFQSYFKVFICFYFGILLVITIMVIKG